MDDVDMGVALSVTSLVMALAQDNPEQYKGAYVKAAARLKRILVDGEYPADYLYYKVPCPWIQVKMLRLLQYFPPSGKLFSNLIPIVNLFEVHYILGTIFVLKAILFLLE